MKWKELIWIEKKRNNEILWNDIKWMKLYKMNEMIGNDHKFINLAGIFKTLVICYFKIFIIRNSNF